MPAVDDTDPGRWRALALLGIALVLAMSPWFSASAVIPQLRNEWTLSDTAAAWLTIGVQLGFVAGALASSVLNLSDVIHPARVMFVSAIGAAGANLLLANVGSAGPAIALRALTGAFLAGVYPPALKLMATWFRRRRGLALGILVGALTLGSASPHLVNGLGGLDWRTVVYVTSALTLLGGLAAATVRDGPYPFPRAVFDPRQTRAVLANRDLRLVSLSYFGHMWELYAMWAWFVVFFGDVLAADGGSPGRTAPYMTFAVIGVGALGCIAGGVLGDHLGRARATMAMMLTSAACALVIGLPSEPVVVGAIGLLWGFTVVGDSAQFSAAVTEVADQAYVGTALTLQLAVGFTLTVATIWLVPLLEDAVGWRWTFAFLAPGPLLGAVAMQRVRRRERAPALVS